MRSLRACLPLILIVTLYAAFLTQTYYWDGVLFSLDIEGVHQGRLPASVLFHPNHLLYSAFGFVLYSAALHCGLHLRAITVLQIFNVVASIAAALAIFRLSKRITTSSSLALFCCVLFAFGATWWKFSTDADCYVISVLFLILTIGFVVQDPPRLAGAAACHVVAMLFHELAVFTYFPVIVAVTLGAKRSKANRFLVCLVYSVATGACVGGAYLLCYFYSDRGRYPSLLAWITSYASNSGFTHSFAELAGSYLTSYIKLFLGGRLSFIRDYFSVAVGVSLVVCFGMLIAAFVFLRRSRPIHAGRPSARTTFILWAWFLPCAIFLASWDPGSAFHKLFVWPPIILLIGAYIASHTRLNRHVHAFSALAAAMAAWNFGAFIYPHSYASSDPVLTLAQTVNRELPKNATVYYRALDSDDWYLEYFAPGRTWALLPSQSQPGQMPTLTGGPVCLETTALDHLQKTFGWSPGMLAGTDASLSWELVTKGHNIHLKCLKQVP